eukprot:2820161-Amphidinium_carterae.1
MQVGKLAHAHSHSLWCVMECQHGKLCNVSSKTPFQQDLFQLNFKDVRLCNWHVFRYVEQFPEKLISCNGPVLVGVHMHSFLAQSYYKRLSELKGQPLEHTLLSRASLLVHQLSSFWVFEETNTALELHLHKEGWRHKTSSCVDQHKEVAPATLRLKPLLGCRLVEKLSSLSSLCKLPPDAGVL